MSLTPTSTPSHGRASIATFGHPSRDTSRHSSTISSRSTRLETNIDASLSSKNTHSSVHSTTLQPGTANTAPPTPTGTRSPRKSTSPTTSLVQEAGWGANFWVTLVDPQSGVSFYACPSTGQVSWDPPVGNFVLPPSAEGEWWELADESRGGIPYYYHTKSGATVWERPDGFVIPLAVLQNTALGRRLSMTMSASAFMSSESSAASPDMIGPSVIGTNTMDMHSQPRVWSETTTPTVVTANGKLSRRSRSYDQHHPMHQIPSWAGQLPPIPGSPYATSVEGSAHGHNTDTPHADTDGEERPQRGDGSHPGGNDGTGSAEGQGTGDPDANRRPQSVHIHADARPSDSPTPSPTSSPSKSKPKSGTSSPGRSRANTVHNPVAHRSKSQPSMSLAHAQSLGAAVEYITAPPVPPLPISISSNGRASSDSGHGSRWKRASSKERAKDKSAAQGSPQPRRSFGVPRWTRDQHPPQLPKPPPSPSPRRPVPPTPGVSTAGIKSGILGKEIGMPVLDVEATMHMSPVKNRLAGKPIPVAAGASTKVLIGDNASIGPLPHALIFDIQQFIESDFAKQYFSKHRTGFIFRRQVPMEQLMTWQKVPLSAPLLTVNRALHKDVVKIFKVIQRIMGDRERERPIGSRTVSQQSEPSATSSSSHHSPSSKPDAVLLEEERWLLGEGLRHGELRDEIYCQLMKQLTGNPNATSVFKGWQLLCVLLVTFPPSKDFEPYLQSFIGQRTGQTEGRVDVMAKYCLKRLVVISKKGPRGKPPTLIEIETASDAAFNPSTFGESLDAVFRLQERNYPQAQVPIILPFLADGILALGGTKSEGIFRVPGDGDLVSDLKLRLDRGYYTLDGVDDPHVLASLFKLWLRELLDPLVPDEMYNDCIEHANDPLACVQAVERLPTINRRVVIFVVSFLQLFLEEKVQTVTKMTSQNLALVMAPNILRCNSNSISVAFTNAAFEQTFVHNLLLHLKCDQVDPQYIPVHGLGAVPPFESRKSNPGKRR